VLLLTGNIPPNRAELELYFTKSTKHCKKDICENLTAKTDLVEYIMYISTCNIKRNNYLVMPKSTQMMNLQESAIAALQQSKQQSSKQN